jgi:hypothetical protein
MSEKETGGPAFPLPLGTMNCAEPNESGGMTLRDYFAAKALPALLELCHYDSHEGITYSEHCAKNAYEVADSMLKARSA